jgi:hypothetical protein
MTILGKIHEIIDSTELSHAEKLDRLYALIPADSCKIDNLSQATPAQAQAIERWVSGYQRDATGQAPRIYWQRDRVGKTAQGLLKYL